MTIFELITGSFITLFSAAMSIIWAKSDRAEKMADSNHIFIQQFIKNLDKTAQLTERLTSLEASVQVEIKNLSVSIKRLEAAVLKISNY